MSNFSALYRSLDSRHLQEQANSGSATEERSDVDHDLPVFSQVHGWRDGPTSGLERPSDVHVTWQPG